MTVGSRYSLDDPIGEGQFPEGSALAPYTYDRHFSLDILVRSTNADQLNLSVGYLHARNIRVELPDGTGNYDGLQLQYAPDWTVSGGYFHDFQWETGYLRAATTSRYEDSFYADFSHTAGGRQQSYIKSHVLLVDRRLERRCLDQEYRERCRHCCDGGRKQYSGTVDRRDSVSRASAHLWHASYPALLN